MQHVLSYLKKYRRHLTIGPSFKLTEAILELIIPLVVARMIDQGLTLHDRGLVVRNGLLGLLLAAIGLVCALVCQYTASLAAQGYGTDLRNALMEKILNLDQPTAEKLGSASLANRLTSDTVTLQLAVAMLIRLVVRAPFLSIGGLVMALLIDWQLALVFVAVLPLFGLVLYAVISRSVPLYRRLQQRLDELIRIFLESLDGSRVIRAFTREKEQAERFAASNRSVAAAARQAGQIGAWLNPATTLILNAAVIAILWLGGFRIETGRLTPGELIAMINYLGQILAALMVVANLVVLYTKAYAAARRVEEVLVAPYPVDFPAAGSAEVPGKMDGPAGPAQGTWAASGLPLVFDNVHFSYPQAGAPLFQGISFALTAGETLGIIGPTGAGKSTLAALLLRQYDVLAGEIRLSGRRLPEWPRSELLACLAWVPQKSILLTGTIAANLRLARPDATDADLWWALTIAQTADFVRQLPDQLASRVEQGGRNFSGGQRQRLAIARALVARPALLILDDCTSALDYATDAALRLALARDPLLRGLSCLVISQRVATIRQADRVLVLDDGQVVGFGTHDALLADNQTYQEIVQSQLDGAGGGRI